MGNEDGGTFEAMEEFATTMNGMLSMIGIAVLLCCVCIVFGFLCLRRAKKRGKGHTSSPNSSTKDEVPPQSPMSTEMAMGTTDRYAAAGDTLDLYTTNDDEKQNEYVTPMGGDDIKLELMNGYDDQDNVQRHDDDEKDDEYVHVTAGGPDPDMDLNESDDDVIKGNENMGGSNDVNIDEDDDDDVLLDGISATLGNVQNDDM